MNDLKLGKLPYKEDARTLKLETILLELPPIPNSFMVDNQFKRQIPMRMFLNDTYGDCVIAGRANHTLRFEMWEQSIPVTIRDDFVKNEYFKESGGQDTGLYMMDSLKAWRKGWWINSNHRLYQIDAFAEVDKKRRDHVKAGIYLLNGLQIGFEVPRSCIDQFNAGEFWDVVSNDGGILGGHCVYILGYAEMGPICQTWAKIQPMTWRFFEAYCDEVWAVVDNRDRWMGDKSPVDVEKLNEYLAAVEG